MASREAEVAAYLRSYAPLMALLPGGLLDMRPSFAFHNSTNCSFGDAKQFCYAFLCHAIGTKLANVAHLIVGELRLRMLFSGRASISHSPLFYHILCIIRGSAKPKMGRVNTAAIVTFMTNKDVIRDGAKVQFVGEAMNARMLFASVKYPIATIVDMCLPFPTLVRAALIYIVPESFSGRTPYCSRIMPLDIADRLSLNPAIGAAILTCNRRGLAASAHAQSAGVGAWPYRLCAAVSMKKAIWFVFSMPSLGVRLSRNFGLLTATAMAVTVGDFLQWIIGFSWKKWELWSMLGHVIRSLLASGRARDVSSVAWHFVLGCYRSNCSTFEPVTEACHV